MSFGRFVHRLNIVAKVMIVMIVIGLSVENAEASQTTGKCFNYYKKLVIINKIFAHHIYI